MKRIFLLISVLLLIQPGQALSQTITCESIADSDWWTGMIKTLRSCFMQSIRTIDTDAVSVSPFDSSVLGLNFYNNKNISFLPIKLDETYPNLERYDGRRCSLKTVSKNNFRNLKQLNQLYLTDNQIERINSDTFEDLRWLEVLDLGDNKIKQMNGAALVGQKKLRDVWLYGNVCIDKNYRDPTAIAISLVEEASKNCAFTEPESSVSQTNEQTGRIESLTKENRELSSEGSTMKTSNHWNLIFMNISVRLLA